MIIQNKKVIQILTFGMRWQLDTMICEEISHCYSWKPVSNDMGVRFPREVAPLRPQGVQNGHPAALRYSGVVHSQRY